jgi:hypothetical protein
MYCDPTGIRTPILAFVVLSPIQLNDRAIIVAIEGIEPTSHGYEPSVITIIRYRHDICGAAGIRTQVNGLTVHRIRPLLRQPLVLFILLFGGISKSRPIR